MFLKDPFIHPNHSNKFSVNRAVSRFSKAFLFMEFAEVGRARNLDWVKNPRCPV